MKNKLQMMNREMFQKFHFNKMKKNNFTKTIDFKIKNKKMNQYFNFNI